MTDDRRRILLASIVAGAVVLLVGFALWRTPYQPDYSSGGEAEEAMARIARIDEARARLRTLQPDLDGLHAPGTVDATLIEGCVPSEDGREDPVARREFSVPAADADGVVDDLTDQLHAAGWDVGADGDLTRQEAGWRSTAEVAASRPNGADGPITIAVEVRVIGASPCRQP